MKRGLLLLFGAVLLVAARASAQDASVQDDMRFIEELRKQGKKDYALKYLDKLAMNPSPDLAKALPLETALTRLEAAGDEPDSAKRLAQYGEARDEFQKWLQANPGDPRAGEVNLNMAHVAVLQGRTQLSQALTNPDFDAVMVPEAFKARAMLEDAGRQLQTAAAGLDAQIAKLGDPKTPADKDLKKKLEGDRMRAELDVALNLFDQGLTYPANAEVADLIKARNAQIQAAQKLFQKLAAKDEQNPVCWTAKAWDGRCFAETDQDKEARGRFTDILSADPRVAAEARRLAQYFVLLIIKRRPQGMENDAYIVKQAKEWLANNGLYGKTPEGYGILFLLGQEYEILAAAEKDPLARTTDFNEARKYYRQVEESENDFTDRARHNKIQIIATQQGGFKEPIEQLKTFEDCYVRAQWEMIQQAKEEKEAKTPEDADKVRKQHNDVMTAALERGLKLADESKAGHGDEGLELANAKAMLAFQYMTARKYREAIAIGQKLIQTNARSSQAAAAAVYVLQSYAEMVGKEEAAEKPPAELPADRKSMFDFAQNMVKTWAKEPAGDMARHQLALLYINAKIDTDDPDAFRAQRSDNVRKAIESLAAITPTYPQYTVAQFQLAQFCFQAEKEKLAPLPGDAEDGYHKRAVATLVNLQPPPDGADPTSNKVYFMAKLRIAQEDFSLKKYDDLVQLTGTLAPLLAKVRLDAKDEDDKKLHADFEGSINSYSVLARWGLADVEARAAEKADPKDRPAHYENVLKLLDPIVDEIAAHKHPELKNNQPLARGVLDNALRATIQLNRLERTQVVLNCYKELAPADAPDGGASEVLKELVAFIPPQLEELKHKGDAAALEAAKKKFGEILADTLKPLQGDKLTPSLVQYTARIYSSMERHQEAADLLEKVAEPAMDAADADKKLYQAIRLQLVRERRLNKELPAARKLMDEILGTDPKKPGWGKKEIPALIENIELVGAEGDNKAAAEYANGLAQKLLPNIDTNPRLKEVYLQCYCLMVENVYKQAVKQKDKNAAKYAEGLKMTAGLTAELAKKQLGFVNDATRGRIRDLMDATDTDPELKADFLDVYLTLVEGMAKQAQGTTNEQQRAKAYSDAASLIVDLEKMWPDYGSDAAKTRATALLDDAALKSAYDTLKGAAATP